ncbi:cobalamin adenosyltransferase [Snodgrassella sp. ESL0253]|uniref:cobalamin adenosyltransferase n=1 Tax=Snodgrassella sp. ESL0253 TaxID=2705031 RepID=UPI00158405F4|nr:cobalamin adenosyltransferase [Snodgrassella sp. ESL0253]NUE65752.1 cobalamin adenosyltransferase [Snodgrassella sp. ESL0253]
MIKQEMDWGKELHNTVVESLVTSFGLDFLLFKDKVGGDVDTIHNVRQGIYATEAERIKFEQRAKYDPREYHSHDNYIATNRQGKIDQQSNKLKDAYTGQTFAQNDKKNLDHVIAASQIHNDPGRVLAEISGADLANHSSNLCFTNATINKSKKAYKMTEFVSKLNNELAQTRQKIAEYKNKPSLTEQEKKSLKNLENKEKADFNKMLEIDKKARAQYEKTINTTYYTSSKFAKNIAKQSAISGFTMGTRQMLGLILAEVWFELRDQLPAIYQNNKYKFYINNFLNDISNVFKAIWKRIKIKFNDFLNSFKDGAISGVLSSATTTITNIFFTTQKILGKMIREMWGHIVKVVKLIFFNPQSLSLSQLVKEASKIISSGISVVCGTIIYSSCSQLFAFPFGTELSAFCGALVTGILTLAFNYYLENGDMPQKIWAFLDKYDNFKDKYQKELDFFKNVNAELDVYLKELAELEFNLNTQQLESFTLRLTATNDELERSILLKEEIKRRDINLPFEAGDLDSVHLWLKSL